MTIFLSVSLVVALAIAALALLKIYMSREARLGAAATLSAQTEAVMSAAVAPTRPPESELLPAIRSSAGLSEDFNVADYSDDRAVLVNDLMIESQRVTRKLEYVSNALREDVSTITGLSDKIIKLQTEIAVRDEQIRDFEQRLAEQRNETIRALEEKGQLGDRVEQLDIELARRTNTLEATKETLLSMENAYRDLLGQNNSLKSELAHLHEDVQAAQARAADLGVTLEHRDAEMHRVNMELAEVRTDVTSERNRANLAEAKVTRLLKQLDEVKAEAENDVDRYRSERDLFKVKLDQSQDALEAQRQRLTEAERNRDRAISQVEMLRNELAAYRADTSTKTSAMESANRELTSHIAVLERILEQYRMKPGSPGAALPAPGQVAGLRVVSQREGENG